MLNGTFLVQAIHFFIAYVIIERFLFRPALSEINADRLEKAQLQEVVDAQTLKVKELEQAQDAFNSEIHHKLAQAQPTLTNPVYQKAAQEIPVLPVLSPALQERLINESVAKVVSEVEHA